MIPAQSTRFAQRPMAGDQPAYRVAADRCANGPNGFGGLMRAQYRNKLKHAPRGSVAMPATL